MPYDPNFPTSLTVATAAQMRTQLQGIVDLIDTIPQGPQGVPGPAGASVSGAVVDGVATVNPGDAAAATVGLSAGTLHFAFSIPRGEVGAAGATGADGATGALFTSFGIGTVSSLDAGQNATASAGFDGSVVRMSFGIPRGADGLTGAAGQAGSDGAPGATGPAFTSFTVDSVTTLSSFQVATVTATFDGTFVRFAFGIPQGQQGVNGNNGADGSTGPQGPQGIQGPPGPSDLSGTSSNSNGVTALGMAVSDPPTQAQMQAIANKLDELLGALRRA